MDNEKVNEILHEFDQFQHQYADFAESVSHLISRLLSEESIQVHSVTYRCKTRQSLEKKISRPEKSYSNLADITDLVGVRITTYFSDDVDKIAAFIERELLIDPSASIDKRKFDQPDRFGYLSLHYIAALPSTRSNLSEYRRFSKMRFEIQIRSILQHAWAEIEHDLGYKAAVGVPSAIRRRFARIAGLLELADDEFVAIRQALGAHEQELPQLIDQAPFSVDLDLTSLRALFEIDSYAKRLDLVVVNASGSKLADKEVNASIENYLDRLRFFGITTVGLLEKVACEDAALVAKFAKYWMRPGGTLNLGIGLFYLAYVQAWKISDRNRLEEYLNSRPIGKIDERKDLIDKILCFSPDKI